MTTVIETAEEWRSVAGFSGYFVSNLGHVATERRGRPRRQMRTKVDRRGYLRVTIRTSDGRPADRMVHRLVAEAFHGPRPDGLDTRHIDGDKTNNAASNLVYGTRSENELDKVRHGRHHNARKTHCPQGHPYDEENTYITPSTGDRLCRTCIADRVARRGGHAA